MPLDAAAAGLLDSADVQTVESLLPIVYKELRQLAASRLRQESPGQTLQTTALVHETYLRLVRSGGENLRWQSRAQFFAAASEAMRRIIIENYRRKQCTKRGGKFDRTEIEMESIAAEEYPFNLLAINEALEALEAIDATKALLVKLRYFADMSMPEVARVLEVSLATTERHWRYARAWLADYLKDPN